MLSVAGLVGGLVIAKKTLRILQFLWLYFLRPSSAKKYLHGPAPYAVVTGATDGIGKAIAIELFRRGFNLIIHGRNEAKVQKVIEEIKAYGSGNVQYFLADATQSGHDFARLVEPFRGLHITLVIHNVGGSHMTRGRYVAPLYLNRAWTDLVPRTDTLSQEQATEIVVWNDVFPLQLTRVLLPQLRAAARTGPVLVEFVGSLSGHVGPATMAVYGASKAFLHVLAHGLDNEERRWGAPSGVRFAYLDVGPVNSATNRIAPSLMTPSSPAFAKTVVDKLGCGRRYYAPYFMHELVAVLANTLPESWFERWSTRLMKQVYAAIDKAS